LDVAVGKKAGKFPPTLRLIRHLKLGIIIQRPVKSDYSPWTTLITDFFLECSSYKLSDIVLGRIAIAHPFSSETQKSFLVNGPEAKELFSLHIQPLTILRGVNLRIDQLPNFWRTYLHANYSSETVNTDGQKLGVLVTGSGKELELAVARTWHTPK
jgi:hypothetical protein